MTPLAPDPSSFLPLPHLSFQILLSLAGEELHGYAIAREVEERCSSGPLPSTGSLYLAIKRLEANGLITEARVERRRTVYRLTPRGLRVAEAEASRLQGLVTVAAERNLLADTGQES